MARRFYLKNPTPPGAANGAQLGSVGQHTKPHPQHTKKGKEDREKKKDPMPIVSVNPGADLPHRRFSQEGNRAPVSEATHSRNWERPVLPRVRR